MSFDTLLHCQLLQSCDLVEDKLLFAIDHQARSKHPPIINLLMPSAQDNKLLEAWSVSKPITEANNGDVTLRYNDDFCLAIVSQVLQDNVAKQTQALYSQLLNSANSIGFKHMLRTWNYIPKINQGDGDNEVYRQFSLGRYQAFEQLSLQQNDYSAASALGHSSNQLVIYLLFAKKAGKHFENPQQTSAYQYPKDYGPISPSFARATYCDQSQLLFISGTASIVGYKTQHKGDAEKQLMQSIDNIEQLVASVSHSTTKDFIPSFFKAYIRNSEHAAMVIKKINAYWPNTQGLFLQADICREDLLVEIEVVYR